MELDPRPSQSDWRQVSEKGGRCSEYTHVGDQNLCWLKFKKNTDPLVVANKEIELEVNADRTKYIVMSRQQNAKTVTVPLKGWNSSNIWEQSYQIKILFRKKLRAD